MNHLKWMGHSAVMLEISKMLYDNNEDSCDVSIFCQGKVFKAHKFILKTSSDFFKEIFNDFPPYVEPNIILPDVKQHIFENILVFMYTGEVSLSSQILSDFLETINLLGIRSPISFDINRTDDLIVRSPEANEKEEVPELPKCTSQTTTSALETEPMIIECPQQLEQQSNVEKDFEEYLEVYDQKVTYTIEHDTTGADDSNDASNFVLADSQPEFTFETIKTSERKLDLDEQATMVQSIEDFEAELVTSTQKVKLPVIKAVVGNNLKGPAPVALKHRKLSSQIKKEIASTSNETFDIESSSSLVSPSKLSRNHLFEIAMGAVVNQKMSLQKAASKFNVSKTVLWRRLKKDPNYKAEREHPRIMDATFRLQAGQSLKSISLLLNIPISTLHRHKVRLLKEGQLPEHLQVKKRDSKDSLRPKLMKAITACQQGMSQNHAATIFDVPKSTLWRHLQKLNPIEYAIDDDIQEQSIDDPDAKPPFKGEAMDDNSSGSENGKQFHLDDVVL